MKIFTLYLFAALLLFNVEHKAKATNDEPAISFTTTNENEILIKILFNASCTYYIDWGDDIKKEYTTNAMSYDKLKATKKGSAIKIYSENIQRFECTEQKINSLDVSNCPTLEAIAVSQNNLSTLNLDNCPTLKYLDISENSISTINLDNCPTLNYLNISDNGIPAINLEKLDKLQFLYCWNNDIETLTIVSPAIEQIKCSNNNISELKVAGFAKLYRLECNTNKLKELNLSGCKWLHILMCNNNDITQLLNLSDCKDLQALSCANNQLTSLDLTQLTEIEEIVCQDNQLSTFLYYKNINYHSIYIQNNNLTYSMLPVPYDVRNYKYAPQATIKLPQTAKTGEAIDLSSAYVVVGTDETQYNWYVNDTQLTENVDYTINNGITTFLKAPTGPAKCIMSHGDYHYLDLETSEISISLATAINEQDVQQTQIYYNNNQVHVKTDKPGQYQVFNLSGACVQSGTLASGNNSFAINGKGIYIVKTKCHQHTQTQKISVQ